jgi:hypothetical protein
MRHLCHHHHRRIYGTHFEGTAVCARYRYSYISPTSQAWLCLEDLQQAYQLLRVQMCHVTIYSRAIIVSVVANSESTGVCEDEPKGFSVLARLACLRLIHVADPVQGPCI